MNYADYQAVSASYHQRFARYNRLKARFLRTYFRLYHRLEVVGREHIPEGPAIIAANHSGGFDLDIMALTLMGCPERGIEVLIDSDWHFISNPWGRYFVGSGLPLWVSAGGLRWDFLDPYLASSGEHYPGLVAIFPEGSSGTIGERHTVRRFYPGVVRIALKYRIPIVPVGMQGFAWACPIFKEWGQPKKVPDKVIMLPATLPSKLRMVFGEPFELTAHYGKQLGKVEEFAIANDEVKPRVAALAGLS